MSVSRRNDSATRRRQAQIAAHILHSLYDSRELTARARAASPASVEYFMDKLDPEKRLPVQERLRRAEHARKAYFMKLAAKSAKARSEKGSSRG